MEKKSLDISSTWGRALCRETGARRAGALGSVPLQWARRAESRPVPTHSRARWWGCFACGTSNRRAGRRRRPPKGDDGDDGGRSGPSAKWRGGGTGECAPRKGVRDQKPKVIMIAEMRETKYEKILWGQKKIGKEGTLLKADKNIQ